MLAYRRANTPMRPIIVLAIYTDTASRCKWPILWHICFHHFNNK